MTSVTSQISIMGMKKIKDTSITKNNMWHPKSMMAFGKVTIVKRKSLLVSKSNHVMYVVPPNA